MKQYIVDAFTEELFGGNPAAVLPCRQMPPSDLMLAIARENNYSETAFVVRKGPGRYDLKWFTPGGEVTLCGHATLATSFVLDSIVDKGVGEMHFDTLSGELVVRRDGFAGAVGADARRELPASHPSDAPSGGSAGYTLDFPVGPYQPVAVSPLLRHITSGLAQEAYYEENEDFIAVVPSEADVLEFEPDYDLLKQLPGRGLILTAHTFRPGFDFVSRCFYPKLDVPEDPVTGSAHTYLTPLWAGKLGKKTMTAAQVSRRGGVLKVHLEDAASGSAGRVFITGSAVLFMEGDIPFDL